MIVKIQRPLSSSPLSDGELFPALIYNESRSFEMYVAYDDVQHLFPNNEFKVFHKAKRSSVEGIRPLKGKNFSFVVSLDTGEARELQQKDTRLVIGKRLKDQSW